MITCPVKYERKLLIHSQTSMAPPLKFGDGSIISSHPLYCVWLLIHVKIKVNSLVFNHWIWINVADKISRDIVTIVKMWPRSINLSFLRFYWMRAENEFRILRSSNLPPRVYSLLFPSIYLGNSVPNEKWIGLTQATLIKLARSSVETVECKE